MTVRDKGGNGLSAPYFMCVCARHEYTAMHDGLQTKTSTVVAAPAQNSTVDDLRA